MGKFSDNGRKGFMLSDRWRSEVPFVTKFCLMDSAFLKIFFTDMGEMCGEEELEELEEEVVASSPGVSGVRESGSG